MDLLDMLQDYTFLAKYSLALFCENEGLLAVRGQKSRLCGPVGDNPFCSRDCQAVHEKEISEAVQSKKPRILSCPAGLLNFVIPFKDDKNQSCYLLGGGVREKFIDLRRLEKLALEKKVNGILLLEEWENLPCATHEEVQKLMEKIHDLLLSLRGENYYARAFEKTMMRISAIAGVGPEMDQATTVDKMVSLLGETLTILFDISRVAIVLPEGDDQGFILKGLVGFSVAPVKLGKHQATQFFQRKSTRNFVLRGEEVSELFPHIQAERLTCLPLAVEGQQLGCLVLFDIQLSPSNLLLVELLAGRVASKLLRIKKEREHTLEVSLFDQFFRMIGTLSLAGTKKELFQNILEMASELVHATKGSLMLLDDTGQNLRIKICRGMNRQIAQSMNVKVGQGIAGRVAGSGQALRVHDIEKDRRIGIPNRQRFKTKSFVSIPLKVKGTVIGVLNLSDKKNQEIFTETEMKMLTIFASHSCTIIERFESLERASQLEELSATDPLTGLYNRRFLEQRIEEELSRSSRQGLELAIMMIDLDHFKDYNDLCGHLAGDKVLQKVAQLLKASAREMDILTRYGGEEFCIILPSTSQKEALLVAERMRKTIEKERFPKEDGLPLGHLTISIGIATFPHAGKLAKGLINSADKALYRAKQQGRNRSIVFDPSLKKDKIVFL
jgi:diguanylate cyclase (GGDEF)-like protein